MPLRSVRMYRFIFGFQRRVWCPKWTPLSSSCFMVTTAMALFAPRVSGAAAAAARFGCRGTPGDVRPGAVPALEPAGRHRWDRRTPWLAELMQPPRCALAREVGPLLNGSQVGVYALGPAPTESAA